MNGVAPGTFDPVRAAWPSELACKHLICSDRTGFADSGRSPAGAECVRRMRRDAAGGPWRCPLCRTSMGPGGPPPPPAWEVMGRRAWTELAASPSAENAAAWLAKALRVAHQHGETGAQEVAELARRALTQAHATETGGLRAEVARLNLELHRRTPLVQQRQALEREALQAIALPGERVARSEAMALERALVAGLWDALPAGYRTRGFGPLRDVLAARFPDWARLAGPLGLGSEREDAANVVRAALWHYLEHGGAAGNEAAVRAYDVVVRPREGSRWHALLQGVGSDSSARPRAKRRASGTPAP